MRNVRRYFEMPGHPVFLTLACRDHEPWLAEPEHKVLVLHTLNTVRKQLEVALYAYVVMDDHMHLMVGSADPRVPKLMASLKQSFSNALFRQLPDGSNRSATRIWQPRYHDHIIRDERDWRAHLDYLHYNPVRHGYVLRPLDHPWSSLGKLVRQGYYEPDWGDRGPPKTRDAQVFAGE